MKNFLIQNYGDLCVVQLNDEITSRSYPEFEMRFEDGLLDNSKVLFNMVNVEFINSIGIVFLLRMREKTGVAAEYFAVYNLNKQVLRALRRLRLGPILNLHDTVEDVLLELSHEVDRQTEYVELGV